VALRGGQEMAALPGGGAIMDLPNGQQRLGYLAFEEA
jgi:hypothetical protein